MTPKKKPRAGHPSKCTPTTPTGTHRRGEPPPATGITREQSNLGGLVAERDADLSTLYVENGYLNSALDHADHRCFVIGRTGSGKSALLRMVDGRVPGENVLSLTASDFTFREIDLSEGISHLHQLGGNLGYLFKTIWKYLLVVALLKRRYRDLRERKGVIQRLMMAVFDPKRARAYEFLLKNEELYGERSFADRLSVMVERLDTTVKATFNTRGFRVTPASFELGEATLTLDLNGDIAGSSRIEGGGGTPNSRRQLGHEISTIVEREWDVVALQQVIELLESDFLAGQRYWVLVDDLDKAFSESRLSADFIKALFEVIMEMSHLSSVRFLVALRTNIFSGLQFYQREKVHAHCMTLRWNESELRSILEQRVRWSFRHPTLEAFSRGSIFPATVREGDRQVPTIEYLLSRTLERPRDLILFAQMCLEEGLGRDSVGGEAIARAEKRYSSSRIEAIEDEWAEQYPALSTILGGFRTVKRKFDVSELERRLEEILFQSLAEAESGDTLGIGWYASRWSLTIDGLSGEKGPAFRLARVLWEVGALGVRGPNGGGWQYCYRGAMPPVFERSRLQDQAFAIHPMFHAALDITTELPGRPASAG